MRLWSLHPKYLDAKGLVALWREGLLAQKVLAGKTTGYRHHPQLQRFREQAYPLVAIGTYLLSVHEEATSRNYSFDRSKISIFDNNIQLSVTKGQILYEWKHLLTKLYQRDATQYGKIQVILEPECHPIFREIPGDIEQWEIR
ncbi:MAG: DNA lyase [SAR324 cluster bacterium]|nr:DNA lyase [SAR324 cluster bacterium]